jgi:hypothetical protein
MLALQEKLQGNIEWHFNAGYMAVHAWLRLAEPSKKKTWKLVPADGADGAPDTKKTRLDLKPGTVDSAVKFGTGTDAAVPAVLSSSSGADAAVPAVPSSASGADAGAPAVPSSASGANALATQISAPLAVVPAKPTSHSPPWILVRFLDKAAP